MSKDFEQIANDVMAGVGFDTTRGAGCNEGIRRPVDRSHGDACH